MMTKPKLTTLFKLLDNKFSVIPIKKTKAPNVNWKEYQKTPMERELLEQKYNLKSSVTCGVITGYGDLECIDVDLKVFSTAKEKVDFWSEYLSMLEDNILDFHEKVVLYKTMNEGYHILYRSKRVEGNKDIAKLKGHTGAVIETRGLGGLIVNYFGKEVDKNRTYFNIDYISDSDRQIIWDCSKYFNYVAPEVPVDYQPKKKKNLPKNHLSTWDDFNNRNTVLDVVGDDFEVIRNLSDKLIIKRYGADSAHSGYIYKQEDIMYLFSTGTIYPSEKVINAYAAYTHKHHNGNFSESAKYLYNDGYGDRLKPEPIEVEEQKIVISNDRLIFPIDVFPKAIQLYLIACKDTLNSSLDFMGCSLLFACSLIVGKSMRVQIKPGWNEYANIWITLVGRAGVGKTPSINNIVRPLKKMNSKEIKQFTKNFEKFYAYNELTKKEKELHEEIKRPYKTQFIVNDITMEALVELHEHNKNGVGVVKDELAGWLLDMNKYREGSDMQQWLSSWSGEDISLTRKTAKSSFVQGAFIPVMGGIQPEVLNSFTTEENKTNGFLDRMLFSFPDLNVEEYNESEMNEDVLRYFDSFISAFFAHIKNGLRLDLDDEIEPQVLKLSAAARKAWIDKFNEITKTQNSDEVPEYMKSMLPKQKSYIIRFSLLLHVLHEYSTEGNNYKTINIESIEKAARLSDYFCEMAKKIKLDSNETYDIKVQSNSMKGKTKFEAFESMYKNNANVSRTKAAQILGVSKMTIQRYIKKLTKKSNI